jgi:hypothetical protein
VISTTKLYFNFEGFEQIMSQLAGKYLVSISYNDQGQSIELEYVINEQLHHHFCWEWVTHRYKMSILCQLVHNHQYCIFPIRFRQCLNKIHYKMLESHVRYV